MKDKTLELKLVTILPRVVLAIAYVAVSAMVIAQIVKRSSPQPTATRDLSVNDKISAEDVQTPETLALIGKFLNQNVTVGQSISSDMVGTSRVPAKLAAPAPAVIVQIDRSRLRQRLINEGVPVVVIAAADVLHGVAEKIDCDQIACAVFVSIAQPLPLGFDHKTLAAADIFLDVSSFP